MSQVEKSSSTQLEKSLESYFAPFRKQAQEWADRAKEIKVTDESDSALIKKAREGRLLIRQVRLDVVAKHKELKEDALRTSQILDGIKRELLSLIEPTENYLKEQEDFIEIRSKKRKEQLFKEREEALRPYMGDSASLMALGEMDQATFDGLLAGQKVLKEQKEAQEKVLAEEKARQQREAEEEKKRIQAENERLRKEQAEKNAQLEKERQARLQLEREAESKRKAEEEEKKEQERIARKLRRAPDKEKLLLLAEQIKLLNCPKLKDDDAQKILNNATSLLGKVVEYITKNAENL